MPCWELTYILKFQTRVNLTVILFAEVPIKQWNNLLTPIVHYLILSRDLYLMDLTLWVLKCFCSLQKLSRVWFTTDKMNFSKSPFSYHPCPILTSSTGQRCHWPNFKSVWKELHFYNFSDIWNFSLLQLLSDIHVLNYITLKHVCS